MEMEMAENGPKWPKMAQNGQNGHDVIHFKGIRVGIKDD